MSAPEMKVVVDPNAKLGHFSPCCGQPYQLYQSDHGLTCPNCNTVYVAEKPHAVEKPEPAKPAARTVPEKHK